MSGISNRATPVPVRSDALGNGRLSIKFHQASGMVAAQADCTISDAVVLMEQRALADGQSVEQVAQDVLRGKTQFGPPN